MSEEQNGHILSTGFLTAVLGALLVLTVVTVWAAQIDFGMFKVVVALSIATVKALVVIMFFMHLKYEDRFIKLIVFICFLMLAIFIGMTFLDVAYRLNVAV